MPFLRKNYKLLLNCDLFALNIFLPFLTPQVLQACSFCRLFNWRSFLYVFMQFPNWIFSLLYEISRSRLHKFFLLNHHQVTILDMFPSFAQEAILRLDQNQTWKMSISVSMIFANTLALPRGFFLLGHFMGSVTFRLFQTVLTVKRLKCHVRKFFIQNVKIPFFINMARSPCY